MQWLLWLWVDEQNKRADNHNNNNKNGAYKALTTEVYRHYNKQNTMINNNITYYTKTNYK